jgi:hypothetical protein
MARMAAGRATPIYAGNSKKQGLFNEEALCLVQVSLGSQENLSHRLF